MRFFTSIALLSVFLISCSNTTDTLEVIKDTYNSKPVPKIDVCLKRVHNRRIISKEVLKEFVDHVKSEPDSVFEKNSKYDIYSSVYKELGPWASIKHRKAVMVDVLRVMGAYESSYNWLEGRDKSASNYSDLTVESGIFQTSCNSLYFSGKDYMKSMLGKTDCRTFVDESKKNHAFVIGQTIRVIRNTVNHHGPVKRKEINKWLSRDCVRYIESQL